MLSQNFLDEITKSFKIKGKKIHKASCVVQLFPEDGALMLQMPVRDDLSVGAILQPDKDDYRNVWLLLPVTSSYGSSAKPVADLSIIQQYLEEFIICCKACFKAYDKRSSAYTLFNCASENSYISNNFYQAYIALENQWEVECTKVSSDHKECVIDMFKIYTAIQEKNVAENCLPFYEKGLLHFNQEDLDSAIAYFTNAIKCYNNYAPAYFFRARSYWRKKNIDLAIDDMMRALNIAEQDSSAFATVEDLHLADIYFDLGLLHSEINELEKAKEYYTIAQSFLKKLSVSSSKRKSDYQRLEMCMMANSARIQNEYLRKKRIDFIATNSRDLPQEKEVKLSSFSETSVIHSRNKIDKTGFDWLGGIGCGFIFYFFAFAIMFFIGVLIVGAGYSWFWCWVLCGIVVLGFIRDLLEHLF